jgi:hypothetical protein
MLNNICFISHKMQSISKCYYLFLFKYYLRFYKPCTKTVISIHLFKRLNIRSFTFTIFTVVFTVFVITEHTHMSISQDITYSKSTYSKTRNV